MGYTTDFSGSFKLNKPLSEKMKEFMTNLASTRRMGRSLGDKYGVEGEFFCEDLANCGQNSTPDVIDHNEPPRTQPGLWLQWVPNSDGTAIEWDGGEKFYYYTEWLLYIIHKILAPNGYVLNGEVTWQGEETGDVGEIIVKNNKVFTHPYKGKKTELKIEDVVKTKYDINFKRSEIKDYMQPEVVMLIDNAPKEKEEERQKKIANAPAKKKGGTKTINIKIEGLESNLDEKQLKTLMNVVVQYTKNMVGKDGKYVIKHGKNTVNVG